MNILLIIEELNCVICEENEGLFPDDYSLLEVISSGIHTMVTFLGIPIYNDCDDGYIDSNDDFRKFLLEKMNDLLDLVVRMKLPDIQKDEL
jgi:hypothetical protein